jgi:hypothetical protein
MLITNYQASQMESGFPFCRIKIKKHTEQAFDAKAVPNPLKKEFFEFKCHSWQVSDLQKTDYGCATVRDFHSVPF